MAQTTDQATTTTTVQKRGPGRPPKSVAQPPSKRQKLSAPATKESTPQTVISIDSPVPEKKAVVLPTKISASRPLPALPSPQPASLSDAEYASILSSTVLTTSLERSRATWTSTGMFDRYWTKPETGKNARPPPPNNPEVKSMKTRGRCRLRIEPHIFEVEIFVVEKPRPPPPPKQYIPYGTPYRPNQPYTPPQQQQQWQGQQQNRPAHPGGQQAQGSQIHTSSPRPTVNQQSTGQSSTQSNPASATAQDKKRTQDPVIGMLATRAGSDPELKTAMREVALGKASPQQLTVFQRHIDELTEIIKSQMAKDNEEERKKKEQASRPATHGQASHYQQPPYNVKPPQQPYVPPPPGEVVFSFTTPGASADRFLFPQHCILEGLTPQHLLASFMVTRKGRDAPNSMGLEADKEYWTPVTLMVEVAYGREGILADVKKWVKGADDVREHMKKVMDRCERVPDTHLALRLPFKGSSAAEVEGNSKSATPVPTMPEEKKKRDSKVGVSALKKSSSTSAADDKAAAPANKADTGKAEGGVVEATSDGGSKFPADGTSTTTVAGDADIKKENIADGQENHDGRRSTRATRKSVRISEP